MLCVRSTFAGLRFLFNRLPRLTKRFVYNDLAPQNEWKVTQVGKYPG